MGDYPIPDAALAEKLEELAGNLCAVAEEQLRAALVNALPTILQALKAGEWQDGFEAAKGECVRAIEVVASTAREEGIRGHLDPLEAVLVDGVLAALRSTISRLDPRDIPPPTSEDSHE